MTATLHIGDAVTVLKTLPDASVDLVVTSPPYLALRSYLAADHPGKAAEMGSEANPAEFIDVLLDVTEQLARVLAPHGSICIELGDTYGGAERGWTTDDKDPKLYANSMTYQPRKGDGWPQPKSLCMIPEAYRLALAYGTNPFNGRTTPRWRVRNVVRHFRPNPPVGALGDKWRPATSDWAVACVGGRRYFDLDAVRTEYKGNHKMGEAIGGKGAEYDKEVSSSWTNRPTVFREDRGGAPPLDWYEADDLQWKDAAGIILPTHGYPSAHYATFSPKLISRFVSCMCPTKVCVVCGKPSERIVAKSEDYAAKGRSWADVDTGRPKASGRERNGHSAQPPGNHIQSAEYKTLGWSDCGHNQWRPGVILDPFTGSGTTLEVATGHGYDAIGIELNDDNLDLITQRVGMFLTVEGAA